jgi:hypothetical protein
LIDTIMELPPPWAPQQAAGSPSPRGKKTSKDKKKAGKDKKKGKKGAKGAGSDGADAEEPMLDEDIDFGTPFADSEMTEVDVEDETLDVEGALDDLEHELDQVEGVAAGPKWHKTT